MGLEVFSFAFSVPLEMEVFSGGNLLAFLQVTGLGRTSVDTGK